MRPSIGQEEDAGLMAVVSDALDDSVRDYDVETRHRLRRAREDALRAVGRADAPALYARWMGFGAALAGCLLFWVMWGLDPSQSPRREAPMPELLAMAAEPELYRDLEFYQWMAQDTP